MLEEADDLNGFFRTSDNAEQLLGRAASFCLERSGYNEGGLNDQGLAFFLPNATWLQPPGHVHAIVNQTWQPNNLKLTAAGGGCGGGENGTATSISAQASADLPNHQHGDLTPNFLIKQTAG